MTISLQAGWATKIRSTSTPAVVGGTMLFAVVLVTLLGPQIYQVDPMVIVGKPMLSPGSEGAPPFGTDGIGRDVLAGVLAGGSITLTVGAAAGLLSLVLGVTIGGLAGYFGGWVDGLLMRVTEFFQVLPILLFAMVVVALFEPSILVVTIAIGSVAWPATARITRAEFLRIRGLEYVKAGRTVGMGQWSIMARLVLPNALPPILVISTLVVGSAMLFESGLSYLGLSSANDVSWGSMLGANRERMSEAWWPVTLPGLAIFISVLSVSLIGDGLNDILNPKRKTR